MNLTGPLTFDLPAAATVLSSVPPVIPPVVPTTNLAEPVVDPAVIFICCVVAAVGTALLLPMKHKLGPVMTKVGGLTVLVALAVLVGNVLAYAANTVGAGFFGFGAMGPYFWIFSVLAIAASVRVITHPRPVYSALWFVLTIFASAGLFILLFAEFMAAALVTIYAGAILVTYTFVIMLASDAGPERAAVDAEGNAVEVIPDHDAQARDRWAAAAGGFLMAGLLLFATFARAPSELPRQGRLALMPYAPVMADPSAASLAFTGSVPPDQASIVTGSTQRLGVYLMSNQLVALQAAGLVLTVAMIGAIVIARRKVIDEDALRSRDTQTEVKPDRRRAPTVSTPSTPVDDNPNSLPIRGSQNPRQKAYPQT